jgi:hypothetical protein
VVISTLIMSSTEYFPVWGASGPFFYGQLGGYFVNLESQYMRELGLAFAGNTAGQGLVSAMEPGVGPGFKDY